MDKNESPCFCARAFERSGLYVVWHQYQYFFSNEAKETRTQREEGSRRSRPIIITIYPRSFVQDTTL